MPATTGQRPSAPAPRPWYRLLYVQVLIAIAIGIVLGAGGALALTRLVSGLLFGVTATDPAVFAASAATLVGAALAATWIPARRAARVDPMVALRID